MLKINFKTVKTSFTCLLRSVATRWGQKSSLISWNQPGEDFFFHSSARIVACVIEYIILQQTKKQTKTRTQTKTKETKEEKRISPENRLEKIICGRPGEDFSCHPHFQK